MRLLILLLAILLGNMIAYWILSTTLKNSRTTLRSSFHDVNKQLSDSISKLSSQELLKILENGSWMPSNHSQVANPYLSGKYKDKRARKCFENDTNINALKYVYSLPIQQKRTVLKNTNILFVGDSLLEQLVVEFSRFGNTAKYHKAFTLVDSYRVKPMPVNSSCYENHTSECPPYAWQRKGDQYVFASTMESLSWTKTFLNKYKNTPENFFLIINIGHHWWKEGQYASAIKNCSTRNGIRDAYVQLKTKTCDAYYKYSFMVKSIFDFLKEQNFNGTLIYVTSPPGYPYCNEKIKVNTPPSVKNVPYNWNKPISHEYKWENIFHQGEYKFNFHVLNISGMSILRGDAHPPNDCLHFCPGTVPAAWASMLATFINFETQLDI